MRRKARVDENHAAIVHALRSCGCSVLSLAGLGSGVPDLLVARSGHMWLMECKKRGSRGVLSHGAARSLVGQTEWADRWCAPVYFVDSPESALKVVGAL